MLFPEASASNMFEVEQSLGEWDWKRPGAVSRCLPQLRAWECLGNARLFEDKKRTPGKKREAAPEPRETRG